jgi:hypothetical protein
MNGFFPAQHPAGPPFGCPGVALAQSADGLLQSFVTLQELGVAAA